MLNLVRRAASWLRTRPLLGRLALGLVPNVVVELEVRELGPFALRLRRNRAFWLRDPASFEHFPFLMLAALIRRGDVVYDVGANLGLYSRFILRHTAASRVLAFEPWEPNRQLFARNARLGGIADRLALLPFALAHSDGTAVFQVDDVQSASGALDDVQRGAAATGRANLGLAPKVIPVETRRIDTLVAAPDVPDPDVVKLDVEGAEDLVLAGAEDLLRRRRTRWLVELHGAEVARRVLERFLAAGYSVTGRVEPHVVPGGYGRLDASHLALVRGLYDLHFLVASPTPEDLPPAYDASASPFRSR